MNSVQTSVKHLAIIMDGNRRWATERGLPKMAGHTKGAKNLRRIVKAAQAKKIQFLTLYTLSTENLTGRSEEELKHLFSLIEKLPEYLADFENTETQFRIIGDISKLPEKTQKRLQLLTEKTKSYTKFVLTLAINYGGRDEIVRATKKIIEAKLKVEQITEEVFANYLDTVQIPDVDLMIRTGGDQRLSNYLPWQTAYAELYFTSVYWPEFSDKDLNQALNWFHEQKRNNGK